MKVLIDTHIAIWSLLDSDLLPLKARDILMDSENEIYYSTVSVWEVVIKHMIRPNDMILDGRLFEKGCEGNGYSVVAVVNRHIFEIENLVRPEEAPKHNDPFDRLLLAQAKAEGMKFMTHDKLIPFYNEDCILSV